LVANSSGPALASSPTQWETRVRHHCDKSYLARKMDRDPAADHPAMFAAGPTGARFYGAARRASRPAAQTASESAAPIDA
jgi:hypothetical protein